MKIAFFGTPQFAVPALEILSKIPTIDIELVVTQPDRPVGRKKVITAPPVKVAAEKFNLPVAQPQNQQELLEKVQSLEVDFFIVIAYGMILKKEILDIPKHGSINIHASLLPKYRGASPIHQSLLNGDTETGITIMKMDEKLDHGPIYLLKKQPISPTDNLETLGIKLAKLGSQMLPLTLEDIMSGHLNPIPQNHQDATHCQKIQKSDGEFKWQEKTAQQILNMIKAYSPWPSTYTDHKGKKLKILQAELSEKDLKAGEIITEEKQLHAGTKSGSLRITKLQPEGSQEMQAEQFINGYL